MDVRIEMVRAGESLGKHRFIPFDRLAPPPSSYAARFCGPHCLFNPQIASWHTPGLCPQDLLHDSLWSFCGLLGICPNLCI